LGIPSVSGALSGISNKVSDVTSGAMAQARNMLFESETMGPSIGPIPDLRRDQRSFWQQLTEGPAPNFGGGKRKRKYKRTRKIHKKTHKHSNHKKTHKLSKHKKSHKPKKTHKRKYKKTKKKLSKRC